MSNCNKLSDWINEMQRDASEAAANHFGEHLPEEDRCLFALSKDEQHSISMAVFHEQMKARLLRASSSSPNKIASR
jgi:hypothetical protein